MTPGWKRLTLQDSYVNFWFTQPVYSPTRKYMLDYKLNSWTSHNILIAITNMETSTMSTYYCFKGSMECVTCFYWLNDFEIVFITQGGLPYNREKESVFYRIFRLDHQRKEGHLTLKWEYLLPRFTKTLRDFPTMCTNPITIKGNAFCVVLVGKELLLLPWDARGPNPSYPPIRIEIKIEKIDGATLLRPKASLTGVQGMIASWANFYGFGDSVYLELERRMDNYDWPFRCRTDQFFKINLSQIDLTMDQIIINIESPEWSLVEFEKLTPNVEYNMQASATQDWQEDEIVIKINKCRSQEGTHVDVFVINLKNQSVFKESVEYHERHAKFTVYNKSYLAWCSNIYSVDYHFQVQPSKVLPMQSLFEICFEKVYLASEGRLSEDICPDWLKKLQQSDTDAEDGIDSDNRQRALIFEKITEKVNAKYGNQLEILSVEQVKKNMAYAKKREEGSVQNIQNLTADLRSESKENSPLESDDSDYEEEEYMEETRKSNSKVPISRALAKKRAAFISEQAEVQMEKLGLDTTSRSSIVNIERQNMWIKIVTEANEKFRASLKPIGVEQAKKLFSNYKIRLIGKVKKEIVETSPNGDIDFAAVATPRDVKPPMPPIKLLRIVPVDQNEKSEIEELRKELKAKDKENAELRLKLAVQAKVLEMVKSTVNREI